MLFRPEYCVHLAKSHSLRIDGPSPIALCLGFALWEVATCESLLRSHLMPNSKVRIFKGGDIRHLKLHLFIVRTIVPARAVSIGVHIPFPRIDAYRTWQLTEDIRLDNLIMPPRLLYVRPIR